MLIIDQIEAQWVIMEWENQLIKLPLAIFPPAIKEGDVLELHININQEATAERRKSLTKKLNNLMQR
ncbi:MAG: DUF3006 domain-containing protein [Clostridia bacterium]